VRKNATFVTLSRRNQNTAPENKWGYFRIPVLSLKTSRDAKPGGWTGLRRNSPENCNQNKKATNSRAIEKKDLTGVGPYLKDGHSARSLERLRKLGLKDSTDPMSKVIKITADCLRWVEWERGWDACPARSSGERNE